mgnify:FL=1
MDSRCLLPIVVVPLPIQPPLVAVGINPSPFSAIDKLLQFELSFVAVLTFSFYLPLATLIKFMNSHED